MAYAPSLVFARCRAIPLTVLALLHAAPALAENAKLMAYGRHMAGECTACHRLDGTDDGIPPIVGRQAGEVAAMLRSYRALERTNPVMVSVARSLDDTQIDALAAYLASLPTRQQGKVPTKSE
jgi:cytochrome c553